MSNKGLPIQWQFTLGPFTLKRQDIGEYMLRWLLVHPWGEIRVHNTSDFWMTKRTTYQAPCILHREAESLHRLVNVQNAWTLVFAGPARRPWGFSKGPGQWTPWREFVTKKESMQP